jgi:putative RNA 2'-phosphotransferase
MTPKELTKASKFLSLVLRHKPEEIGIVLDSAGWTDVKVLLSKMNAYGIKITKDQLKEIVANNDKKRFAFNDIETEIRASQGHSIEVELKYEEKFPPTLLYHGTGKKY